MQYKDQKTVIKKKMNKFEWTKELDRSMAQSVIRNYFNFDAVSMEINREAKKLGLDFGAANAFTNEKCRLRWSYLHVQRKLGKEVTYKDRSPQASASESDTNKENQSQRGNKSLSNPNDGSRISQLLNRVEDEKSAPKSDQIQQVGNIKTLLEQKNFENLTKKQEPKSMQEIEQNLWKNQVKEGVRVKRDFLDTSKEDFSKNKSKGINGQEITPSSFNIFRDSLKKNSLKLLETLNENLPDINLKEITESESEQEEEVLPLDFRTALMEKENKIVIQAKPLAFKTTFEEDDFKPKAETAGLDDYLDMVRKEAFKDDEGAVMIDPDIKIREQFEKIELPCNQENRMNNSLNAPIRAKDKKKGPKMPKSQKVYDTDTDNNTISEAEELPEDPNDKILKTLDEAMHKATLRPTEKPPVAAAAPSRKAMPPAQPVEEDKNDGEGLLFENALKDVGLGEIDEMIGMQPEHSKKGIVQQIVSENKKAEKKRQELEDQPLDMLGDLEGIDELGTPSGEPLQPETTEDAQRYKEFLQSVNALKEPASDVDLSPEKKNSTSSPAKTPGLEVEKQGSSSNSKKVKKVQFYKGMRVMSDTEDMGGEQNQNESFEDPDKQSSSKSSNGSADEYFNQQRRKIRKNLNVANVVSKVTNSAVGAPVEKQTEQVSDEEESSSDDEHARRLEEEKKRQLEMIKKKKELEEERRRQEALRRQRELQEKEMEKKRLEKEELMAKLKRQDEETKKRKQEEKEKKERQRRKMQMIQEQKRQEERERAEEELMQQRQALREAKLREEQEKRQREEVEQRKQDFGVEVSGQEEWEKNGKTEIPSLFDSKCSFLSSLNSIPLDLEQKIQNGTVDDKDLVFRRYKSLIIPIDSHLNNEIVAKLVEYLLLHSNLSVHSENDYKSAFYKKDTFNFKCISMQLGVAHAPLSDPPLRPLYFGDDQQKQQRAIRVISFLFDTHDEPKLKNKSFQEMISSVKLSDLLDMSQLKYIQDRYKPFIHGLAEKYFRAGKVQKFPFEVKTANANYIEFKNEAEVDLSLTPATLGHIAFFAEYTRQDDQCPMSSKESWEFFRRQPSFWAFNPNKPKNQKIDKTKKNPLQSVKPKHNQFLFETACVVFKDITFDPLDETNHDNSLSYFFKKSLVKNGLDLCGLRLIYLDEQQRQEFESVFHDKFEAGDSWDRPVLAVAVRGLDAQRKVDSILGHYNPEIARRANEKSLRALFGRSRDNNCALQIFQQNKKNVDLKFWFGGRITSDQLVGWSENSLEVKKRNTIELVVPGVIEKHFLFLSPCVKTYKLPQILMRLSTMGVTVLDIQKLDFSKFQYLNHNILNLKREGFFDVRGKTFKSEIGFVLKLARENLSSHFWSQKKNWLRDLDGLLQEHSFENLMFLSGTQQEYKLIHRVLKKQAFKVTYSQPEKVPYDKNYDSEDPEHYTHFNLYNSQVQTSSPAKKSSIKPIKKKLSPEEMEQKYELNTAVCFIKFSSFKKQIVGETVHALLNLLNLELIGLKLVTAKTEIYNDLVPKDVKAVIRSVACKLHANSIDYKLRRKMTEFRTLALVLRGQNIEGQIDKVYDRETSKFRDEQALGLEAVTYEGTPHVVFVTNNKAKQPLLDFFASTKYVNLFQDIKQSYSHLNGSQLFCSKVLEPSFEAGSAEGVSTMADVTSSADLLEEASQLAPQPSSCVCIIKPNQSFNAVIRSLKAIANINPDGLTPKDPNYVSIDRIEIKSKYSPEQIKMLYEHDILYDDQISAMRKARMKDDFVYLFKDKAVFQLVITGSNALPKMRELVGDKDPARAAGERSDTLRSYYGVDRLDNGFIVSESIFESKVEEEMLFQGAATDDKVDLNIEWVIADMQEKAQMEMTPGYQIQLQNRPELALLVISPSLVTSNDFIFVIEDFYRSKFEICAIKKKQLGKDEVAAIFKDQIPRVHSLDTLVKEFSRGDSVLLVVEKVKAIDAAQELIGSFSIKVGSDYLKKKQTQNTFQFGQFSKESSLISTYGSFIFSIPNAERNKAEILKEFKSLPLSKNFKIMSRVQR